MSFFYACAEDGGKTFCAIIFTKVSLAYMYISICLCSKRYFLSLIFFLRFLKDGWRYIELAVVIMVSITLHCTRNTYKQISLFKYFSQNSRILQVKCISFCIINSTYHNSYSDILIFTSYCPFPLKQFFMKLIC